MRHGDHLAPLSDCRGSLTFPVTNKRMLSPCHQTFKDLLPPEYGCSLLSITASHCRRTVHLPCLLLTSPHLLRQGVHTLRHRREAAACKVQAAFRLRNALRLRAAEAGRIDESAFAQYLRFALMCHMAAVRSHYLREAWHRHGTWLEELRKQGRLAPTLDLAEVGMLATLPPDSRHVTVSQKTMLRKAPRLTVGAGSTAAATATHGGDDAASRTAVLSLGPGAVPSPSSRTTRVLRHEPKAHKSGSAVHAAAVGATNGRPDSARSGSMPTQRILPPIHAQSGAPAGSAAFLPELTGAVVRETVEEDALRDARDQMAAQAKEIRTLRQQNALLQDINR